MLKRVMILVLCLGIYGNVFCGDFNFYGNPNQSYAQEVSKLENKLELIGFLTKVGIACWGYNTHTKFGYTMCGLFSLSILL